MGIVIPTCAAVTVLVLALAACAYRPGADNPVARSLTWFSYAGAGDIRAECRPGAADRLRLIYNGDYDEQVRSYDVTAVAAGGGMVEVEANGAGELLRVTIEQTLFDRGDREMIENLVPAAVNQALEKAKQLHADAVKDMAGGLNVPGLDEALNQITGGGNTTN